MAISFNETFYLEQKLAQLQAAGETGFETTADVQEAFATAGLTAEAHYLQHGASEGLNPSADFDTNVYLDSKLAQLSAAGGFENITTREELAAFLKDSGLSPLEHYNQHGAAEGVSPSAEFNAQAYLANKLADLQANDTDGTYADWTTDELLAFFNDNGLTPLDHYTQFGRVENISPLPVEEGSGLTEVLVNLQQAQADTAASLEGVAAVVNGNLEKPLEGEALETYQEGYTAKQAQTDLAAAKQAVEDAQADVAQAEANLLTAGTVQFSAYAGGVANFDGNVSNTEVQNLVQNIEFITSQTRMTQANLDRAETDAQALVDNDERQYLVDGATAAVVVDAEGSVTAPAGHTAVYTFENEAGETVYTTAANNGAGTSYDFAGIAATKVPEAYDAATGADIVAAGTPVAYDAATGADIVASGTPVSYSEATTDQVVSLATASTDTNAPDPDGNGDYTATIGGTLYTFTVTGRSDGVAGTYTVEPDTTVNVDAQGALTTDANDIDPNGNGTYSVSVDGGLTEVVVTGRDGTAEGTVAPALNFDAQGALTTDANDIDSNGNGTYSVSVDGVLTEVVVTGRDGTAEGTVAPALNFDAQGALTTATDAGVEYTADDLVELQSAAEVQANITTTQNALDSDIAAKGDNEALLVELRDAILAYSAAGNSLTSGDAADIDGQGTSLAVLLETINGAFATEDNEATDTNEREDAIDAIVADFTADLYDLDAELATDENFEPEAAEKAVQDALDAVTNRDELEVAVEDAKAAFEATVTGDILNTVKALQEERDALEQAIVDENSDLADAEAYASDMQDAVDAYEADAGRVEELRTQLEEEFGIANLVDLEAATESGTAGEGDLYLFSENSVSVEMTNFEADDILFLGTGFTQRELGEDDVLADARLGEAGTLEVFFQQDGDDAKLFVEQFEGAGSALNNAEITEITLTGVSVEDLQFENGQVSIIEAA